MDFVLEYSDVGVSQISSHRQSGFKQFCRIPFVSSDCELTEDVVVHPVVGFHGRILKEFLEGSCRHG
jgi:hypothetical protein